MTAEGRAALDAARAGDGEAMEEVVRQNSGLIWSVARRFFGRGVEPDDLYQLGCVGFLKAVRGFDDAFGTQFSTYAVPKIAGEIRRAQTVRAARSRLTQSLGREPTLSELAADTGIPPEDIASCEIATAPSESLQRQTGEDGFTLEQVLSDDREESLVERVALREAIRALPERERSVIVLRYYRGLTQADAARILGVSQVQVSRVEKRAVEALRSALK